MMVETRNAVGSLGLNLRSIGIIVIVVGAVTGGNLWLNRGAPKLGYERYSGHGFSIEYRKDMWTTTNGLGGGPATDEAGSFQGTLQVDSLEQFGVIWLAPDSLPTHMQGLGLEGALDYIFALIEMTGTPFAGKGELKTSSKDSHEMLYQYFNITESGIIIPGIIGAWYCEDDRILMLYLIHVPDINQPDVLSQELETRWQVYLDSLDCH